MGKRFFIEGFRKILRKFAGRDLLILDPTLTVSERTADSIWITRFENSTKFLPIQYNYHTGPEWQIDYTIRGTEKGILTWQLSSERDGILCTTEFPVSLPFIISVSLKGDTIHFNDKPLHTMPGKAIPKTAPFLIADFSMVTEDRSTLRRRTAHRVQMNESLLTDSDYYQGHVYEDYEQEAGTVPQEIFKSLDKHVTQPGRFLEIGCATGLTVEHARNLGYDAEGIDVSEWAVEQANKRKPGRCRVLNFDQAVPQDFNVCYDVIVLHSVIEHLKNPERAIELLFKLTRPGGTVYIQTLNADSLMHAVMKNDWGGYSDYTHASPWISAKWLEETALQKGFDVVSTRHYHLWNDNVYDDVWDALNKAFRTKPLKVLLEDGYGDAVEMILRRPFVKE